MKLFPKPLLPLTSKNRAIQPSTCRCLVSVGLDCSNSMYETAIPVTSHDGQFPSKAGQDRREGLSSCFLGACVDPPGNLP